MSIDPKRSQKKNSFFLSPLDDAEERVLFFMLGEAWYAQLVPLPGRVYHLAPSNEVGRREFDVVVPQLKEALWGVAANAVYSRVATTLQAETTWKMPVSVVVALARKRGMLTSATEAAWA
jgi:hypothetical protein